MGIDRVNDVETSNQYNITKTKKSNSSSADFSSYLGESKSLDSIFEKAAKKYNVSETLLKAVGKAESNFNEKAVSRCGAQGIMQLMPSTAKSLGVSNSLDAEQNIMGGAKYISGLLKKYDGDTELALAAYNAGSGNVAKYDGIPPFKETQNYVKKVMKYINQGVDTASTAKASSVKTNTNVNTTVPVNHAASTNNDTTATPAINTTSSISVASEADRLGVLQQEIDSVFSYEDYLNFLTKFLEDDKESEEKTSDNIISNINYNVPVMNLLNSIS